MSMSTGHTGSLVPSFIGASPAGRGKSTFDLPKLPNIDDIDDLVKQMQEVTDILSRLLLTETKWRNHLSSRGHGLLRSSTEGFRTFCDGTMELLQTFADISKLFAALFALIFNREPPSDIEQFARTLKSKMERIFTRLESVDQQYASFTSPFRDLMRIAPSDARRDPQQLEKDRKVFQRLDAFWKVVSTQLSTVLERRSEPPSADISRDARNKWLEYQTYLFRAIDTLTRCSDALKASANGLKARHNQRRSTMQMLSSALFTFWFKLTRRKTFA